MSNCNKSNKDPMDITKQYLNYMNYIGTGALWAAKKYAPVSDFAKALGILAAPGALSAQTALSVIGISENKTTPIVGGLSISAPTLAFFGKVGAIISTGAVIAGGTVSTPVALVGAGLTIITIAAAAAGNEKIRDILIDPLLYENISSLDLEKTLNYLGLT